MNKLKAFNGTKTTELILRWWYHKIQYPKFTRGQPIIRFTDIVTTHKYNVTCTMSSRGLVGDAYMSILFGIKYHNPLCMKTTNLLNYLPLLLKPYVTVRSLQMTSNFEITIYFLSTSNLTPAHWCKGWKPYVWESAEDVNHSKTWLQ